MNSSPDSEQLAVSCPDVPARDPRLLPDMATVAPTAAWRAGPTPVSSRAC